MMAEYLDLDVVAAAKLLREGEVSSSELVAATLDQISRFDPEINAFITVMDGQARALADVYDAEIAAGAYRGPLHGIPIAIKDNVHLAGFPTTAGGKHLASIPSVESATVVRRLRDAGAIVVGKLNMHEYAYGVTSANPHYGPVRNPWDTDRIPGGSSGGSAAAVTARMCFAAIGTDTGASVRLPAALNGIVGLRPTIGRVSNHLVVPLCWSLDTVGPMTRSVRDCAVMLEAIAGHDPLDTRTRAVPVPSYPARLDGDLEGVRLALLQGVSLENLDPAVYRSVTAGIARMESAGASIRTVEVDGLEHALSALMTVDVVEPTVLHHQWIRDSPEKYGDDVRNLLYAGEMYSATDYMHAQRYRRLLSERLDEVFRRSDVIVVPTLPFPAPLHGTDRIDLPDGHSESFLSAAMRFTALASLAGLPAISVPCGYSDEGLPIGLQFIGRAFGEVELLAVAAAFERIADAHGSDAPPMIRPAHAGS
ncbi:MAG: amidase [Rhodococcus sp. (in: high G+C Gram-positive bacteria)]